MAQAAADGEVKSSFLGMKTKLSLEKTVAMLGKVRDHAPKSPTASKAQFTIGELYQAKSKTKESIAAFRQLVRDQPESPEAPEALFRVGLILIEDADRGNQNQANVDLAREAFNDYLIQYPGHSRNAEARKMHRQPRRPRPPALLRHRRVLPENRQDRIRQGLLPRHRQAHRLRHLHDAAKARLKELGE